MGRMVVPRRSDAEDWFDLHWAVIERSCPETHRGQRDIDWGATVAESSLFNVSDRVTVPWTRELSVDDWMTDQASHSYGAALGDADRERLLGSLREILEARFPEIHFARCPESPTFH